MRLPLPRAAVLIAIATLLATAAGWWSGSHDVRGQTDAVGRVYLPLAFTGAALSDLPSPAARPTRTVGTTVRPSATIPPDPPTVLPSASPPPTATATPVGDGAITGRLLVDGEPVIEGLGEGIGPGLFLIKCGPGQSGTACPRIDRTSVVGDEGRYAFVNPPALAPGEYYQVYWLNETYQDLFGIPEWLGAWFSQRIVGYADGEMRPVEDIELKNIFLLRPTHGTGFGGLPITFGWETRPDDEYEYVLCDCCGDGLQLRESGRPNFHSPSLGNTGEFTLSNYPPGFQIRIENKYCWYAHVRGAGGSYGMSYETRMLWFFVQDAFHALLGPLGAGGDGPLDLGIGGGKR